MDFTERLERYVRNTRKEAGVCTPTKQLALTWEKSTITYCLREKVTPNKLLVGDGKMETSFSIEMKSKKHVRTISVSNESHNHVLFEGFLGDLQELSMVEGKVLEIKGTNGILRVDLTEDDLRKMLCRDRSKKDAIRRDIHDTQKTQE
ncbi:MAG: hypothetical protein ACETV1_02940 [Candidatus Bathyarchaeia archaeon]